MSGPLVLCGSGEFTTAMADIDRELLADAGREPKVAIVPTAAGQEDTPTQWAAMGSEHFRALGAQPLAVMVLDRSSAHERRWRELVASADWIYFSGGHPGYAVETLAGTPFWEAVVARHRAGAILAGSSAGAMMLGGTTFVPLARGPDGLPTKMTMRPALGLLPGVIVAPHFDIVPERLFASWAEPWPSGHRLLGIDEDTALIANGRGWSVRGRGRVQVMRTLADRDAYTDGATLSDLPPAVLP